MSFPWENETQKKNLAWFLPRPSKSRYKGGFPLHCEDWLIKLAESVLGFDLERKDILQPFAGMCRRGIRMDLKKEVNPDVLGNAHDLPFKDESFWLVLCDPPYSDEEARKLYGTPKLIFRTWAKEAIRVLKKGGVLILYHKLLLPNPDPNELSLIKRVFIGHRTWHVPRIALVFRKRRGA